MVRNLTTAALTVLAVAIAVGNEGCGVGYYK